jgi:hypothetical protein
MPTQKRTSVHEVFYGVPVAESGGKSGKAKNKPVAESKTPKGGGRGGNPIDPPAGAIPAPEGDEAKLWELDPQDLRARLDAQLWPTDDSNHKWVPKPPMSLSDYLKGES